MEDIIKINFTSEDLNKGYYICECRGVEDIKRYNTERFAKILADKFIIISSSNYRVSASKNPHIAEQLTAERCDNWRVDELSVSCKDWDSFTPERAGVYLFNTKSGAITKRIEQGEAKCLHCGEVVDKSQQIGAYCEKCLKREGYISRFGYHSYCEGYKIHEKIDEAKTPVFGCEIERDYLSYTGFDDNLKNALLEVFKTFHAKEIKGKKEINREFVFMSDSSLNNNGCEWITFPHTYKWYKANADRLQECIEIFKKHNFGNSSNVGNHIHINNNYFKGNNKLNACKLALIFSLYWDELKAIAKRTSTGYTARPEHKKEDDLFTLAEKTLNTWRDHNVAVNTQHTSTIELRLWGGIDSVQDLLLLLDLTQALTIYARKKSIETIQKSKFEDILAHLVDKPEHLQAILERLTAKNITRHTQAINKMINKEGA